MSQYMERLANIAEGCLRESADDYIGLWQIATRVRREFGPLTNEQVRRCSLDVVRRILELGLRPGHYRNTGFHFWDEQEAKAVIGRIEREWDVERGDPNLAHPICWFARRPE
jgi:hypothetical protein